MTDEDLIKELAGDLAVAWDTIGIVPKTCDAFFGRSVVRKHAVATVIHAFERRHKCDSIDLLSNFDDIELLRYAVAAKNELKESTIRVR